MIKKIKELNKGFTVLELVISIAIFAVMSALLLARYGNFNQGILLDNLAYDIALTIRNAQSYGLNVRSSSRTANLFDKPYGVHFDVADPNHFIFFVDTAGNGVYNPSIDLDNDGNPDQILSKTTITRGSTISALCVNGCSASIPVTSIDITFKRPDPNAIIKINDRTDIYNSDADITVMAVDGVTIKKVKVRSTGQVTVQ
ncbi:type II secretion system protein [bacterium]|nr:type II secretion system protein [bacterium]